MVTIVRKYSDVRVPVWKGNFFVGPIVCKSRNDLRYSSVLHKVPPTPYSVPVPQAPFSAAHPNGDNNNSVPAQPVSQTKTNAMESFSFNLPQSTLESGLAVVSWKPALPLPAPTRLSSRRSATDLLRSLCVIWRLDPFLASRNWSSLAGLPIGLKIFSNSTRGSKSLGSQPRISSTLMR